MKIKNYLRKITALFPKQTKKIIHKKLLVLYLRDYFFLILVILALIFLQVLVLLNNFTREANRQFETKVKNYKYWSGVASQFPNIPDILYDASLSAFEAGKKGEALIYINKALRLDPLFKEAIQLRDEILK